jgi:phosphonate utilization associated putative membrane protein
VFIMTPLLAVGLSVLLHVSWNLLTRRTPTEANFLWWIVGLYVLAFAPFTLTYFMQAAALDPELYLCALISGTSNGCYFLALRKAYSLAPASAVYPMVRSSPLLIALVESLFFGHRFPWLSWCAILLALSGLWMIASSAQDGIRRLSRAWPYALFAACMTVIYSLSDKTAATNMLTIGTAMGYVCVNFAISWAFLALEQKKRTQRWIPALMPSVRALITGGFGVGTAYALVIYAMHDLPAAYAVTLTNAGIVLTVLLGIVWLKEHEGWKQRIAGSILVVTGVIAVSLETY